MISPWLLSVLRCPACAPDFGLPDDRPALTRIVGEMLICPQCDARYTIHAGYVDMRPHTAVSGKTTVYADEAVPLDDLRVRPPVLSAGVRQYVLRRLLKPRASDALLDIGCGNGKFAVWNSHAVAHIVGLDAAARFAAEAIATVDLVQGDARALPFANGTFAGAYSLDVLEHLDASGVQAHLAETRRVLRSAGAYFCMSNTRERSALNRVIDPGRRLAERLHRAGIVDRTRDYLRKGDHVKVLATADDLKTAFAHADFRLVHLWFLNPVLATYVETLGFAMIERALGKKAARSPQPIADNALSGKGERTRNGQQPMPTILAGVGIRDRAAGSPLVRVALRIVTAALVADVAFFRRVRTGPFFLLARPVVKTGAQR